MKVVNSLIQHTCRVVALLARRPDGVPLGEIARVLHMPKSGLHRLLTYLCDEGWAIQADNGTYAIGPDFAVLCGDVRAGFDVYRHIHHLLAEIARDTSELVLIAIVKNERLRWMDHVSGRSSGLVHIPNLQEEIPLFAAANGKAWLATFTDDEAVNLAVESGLGKRTDMGSNAFSSADALVSDLKTTRARGWALSKDEGEEGITSVATALLGQDGACLGTFSISGPNSRMNKQEIDRYTDLLKEKSPLATGLISLIGQ